MAPVRAHRDRVGVLQAIHTAHAVGDHLDLRQVARCRVTFEHGNRIAGPRRYVDMMAVRAEGHVRRVVEFGAPADCLVERKLARSPGTPHGKGLGQADGRLHCDVMSARRKPSEGVASARAAGCGGFTSVEDVVLISIQENGPPGLSRLDGVVDAIAVRIGPDGPLDLARRRPVAEILTGDGLARADRHRVSALPAGYVEHVAVRVRVVAVWRDWIDPHAHKGRPAVQEGLQLRRHVEIEYARVVGNVVSDRFEKYSPGCKVAQCGGAIGRVEVDVVLAILGATPVVVRNLEVESRFGQRSPGQRVNVELGHGARLSDCRLSKTAVQRRLKIVADAVEVIVPDTRAVDGRERDLVEN